MSSHLTGVQENASAPLAAVLRELSATRSPEEALRRLPELLTGLRWPLRVHVAGTPLSPQAHERAYPVPPGPDPQARCWLLAPQDLPEADAVGLEVFCAGLGALLYTLAGLARTERMHLLTERVAGRGHEMWRLREMLRAVMEEFGLRGLCGLSDHRGQLVPMPGMAVGDTGPLPEWTERDTGALRRGEPSFHECGLLMPLAGRWRARAALWLSTPSGHSWQPHDLQILASLAHAGGLELERVQAERHIATLTKLQESLLGLKPEAAYQPLLEQALRVIPGAETGSLLVREGDLFHFRAAMTQDMEQLRHVTLRVEDVRDSWYGAGQAAWERGTPRLIQRPAARVRGVGYLRDGEWVPDALPSVHVIQANVGVPVLYGGEVYAFLNVDACSDPLAFDQDSVEVARSFALQAALLLRETRQRAEIARVARTDELTGLPNRRAFGEALKRELEQARAAAQSLALLVMDGSGFKTINDRLGHAAGDEALVQLSGVLRRVMPHPELVFRWGGDEFAALLPGTDAAGADAVAAELHAALSEEDVCGLPLRVSVGRAVSQPPHADGGEALLRAADLDMYRQKRGGRPV